MSGEPGAQGPGAVGPDALRAALEGCAHALLTGPVAPDGDSLGACLALARVLERRGVRCTVAGRLPRRYSFLPESDRVVADPLLGPPGTYDAVVVLDGDRLRLTPEVEAAFHAARVRGLVDHHASTALDGYTHAWHEPRAESTCSMLFRAFRRWEVPLDPELAAWLYTGLVFDTGGFRHSNTTPETHAVAAALLDHGIDHTTLYARVLADRSPAGARAMGSILMSARWALDGRLALGRVPLALQESLALEEGDLEGVVEALLHTDRTLLAALLVERSPGQVKISLRSRCDVNVAHAARSLVATGGGHPRAAGASLEGTLDAVERAVERALATALHEREPT